MSEVTEHAALADALLGWARELGDIWFTAEQAAALGATEDEVRAALGELEAEGLTYRSVTLADTWRITADGMTRAGIEVHDPHGNLSATDGYN